MSSLTIANIVQNPCTPICSSRARSRIWQPFHPEDRCKNTSQWPMMPKLHNWNNMDLKSRNTLKMVNTIVIASIVLTYPNWCAVRIHPFPLIIFMACKMYCPFLYMISPHILTYTSIRLIHIHQHRMHVRYIVPNDGPLGYMHRRLVDNIVL